jgi:hypothetical protein
VRFRERGLICTKCGDPYEKHPTKMVPLFGMKDADNKPILSEQYQVNEDCKDAPQKNLIGVEGTPGTPRQ